MLLNARQILVSELTLAENLQKEQVEELVDTKIDASYAEYNGGAESTSTGEIKKLIKY